MNINELSHIAVVLKKIAKTLKTAKKSLSKAQQGLYPTIDSMFFSK